MCSCTAEKFITHRRNVYLDFTDGLTAFLEMFCKFPNTSSRGISLTLCQMSSVSLYWLMHIDDEVVHIDDEVNARITKASATFGRLRGSIWDRSGIRLDTKLKVYRSVVLPTLLYACET